MNKVGRPTKYTNDIERTEVRRKQNMENQRRCRMRKRINKEVDIVLKTNKELNNEYRTNIINFNNQFEYDYFFTGTVDLNQVERNELNKMNKEVSELNQEYYTEYRNLTDKKVGIKSFRKYTERYIHFLSERQLIERCFVVFEVGTNGKYHTHIMFKSNSEKINFDVLSENRWLLGNSLTIKIDSNKDQRNLLQYCTKEMKPTSKKITDLNRVDNWFIWGDYIQNKELVKPKTDFIKSI